MILQIVNAHSNSWNGMHRYLQVLDTVIETVHPRFFRGSILSSREESSGNWSYLLLKILYQKNIRIEEFQLQFTGSIENAWRCAWCANIQHTLSIQLAESNIYKTFVKNRHLFTWSVVVSPQLSVVVKNTQESADTGCAKNKIEIRFSCFWGGWTVKRETGKTQANTAKIKQKRNGKLMMAWMWWRPEKGLPTHINMMLEWHAINHGHVIW